MNNMEKINFIHCICTASGDFTWYLQKQYFPSEMLCAPDVEGNPPLFNGSLRDECLNTNWFMSLEDAQEKIETWRQNYNHFRPYSSLDDVPPAPFAKQFYESQPSQIF